MDSTQKYIRPGTYCAACKGIFKGLLVLDHARPHHSDGAALEQSASTGCQLCFFLWDMLTDTEREWIRRHDERPVEQYKAKDQVLSDPATSYTLSRSADDYSMKYTFLADRYKDDRHSVAKTMGLMPESSLAHRFPQEEAPLAEDVASAVGIIRRWIACCESHQCQKDKTGGEKDGKAFLPTRLVDVGDCDQKDPRLHITSGSPGLDEKDAKDARYLTLSHCWGLLKIRTLEADELEAMRINIELSTLPKTFQDAIRLTRALGIRYLWIDSLCIIQDRPKDWFSESTRMCDIYTNSYLNISATAARDGSQGLFFPRSEVTARPLCIDVAWTGDDAQPGRYCLVDNDLWVREVDDAPLNQRGWVFQERYLASRNLSFGAKQLFWECSGLRACEAFPGGLPWTVGSAEFKVSSRDELNKRFPAKPKKEKKKDDVDPAALKAWLFAVTGAQLNLPEAGGFSEDDQGGLPNAYRQWTTIVSHYSKGRLTKESDRMIALYGVAQSMEKVLDDEYVSGHWKKHLLNQLLWMTYPKLKKWRPRDYRAPSWSWASVIGKVSFRDILEAEHRDKMAEIVDVAVSTTPGKEGQITGGHLTMRSRVLRGDWELNATSRNASARRASYSESARHAVEASADVWYSDWADDQESDNFTFRHLLSRVPWVSGYPDVEPDGFKEGVTALIAVQQRVPPADLPSPSAFSFIVEGLVLKEEGPGTFRRIGIFVANGDGAEYFLAESKEDVVKII